MDSIPVNIAPVHDLLLETIATAEFPGVDLTWGLALFPRTGRFDAPVFGVVTCGGESTTLTYRMLQGLTEQPVWISGRMIATIRDAKTFGARAATPTGLLDQPVLHLGLTCWAGPTRTDMERTAGIDSTIYAGELKAPIILLTHQRISGWPR